MSHPTSTESIQEFWKTLLPRDKADQNCLFTSHNDGFKAHSFKDLNAQANCAAGYLMEMGLKKGEYVGLVSKPNLPAIVFDLALQFLGAVGVHLPYHLAPEELARVADKYNFQFLFAGDQELYLHQNEFISLKPKLKGLFLETKDAEGLSPEKLVTFDIMVMRGKAIWREQLEKLNSRKSAVNPKDTYGLFYKSGSAGKQLNSVTFGQVLKDLSAASKRFENGGNLPILATTSPDNYLHHISGSFSPISGQQPLYLVGSENLTASITINIKPASMVAQPEDIEKMYELLPAQFLGKDDPTPFEKAQALIGVREQADKEGKKAPFMKSIQYKTHNQRLYRQVRKKLGGQLAKIVCGDQQPAPQISRFIEECGISIEIVPSI